MKTKSLQNSPELHKAIAAYHMLQKLKPAFLPIGRRYMVHRLCCECGSYIGLVKSDNNQPVFEGLCQSCGV